MVFSSFILVLLITQGCSAKLSRIAPENGDAVSFPLTFSWDKSAGKCKKIGLIILTQPVDTKGKAQPVGSMTAVENTATKYVMSATAWSEFKEQNGQHDRYYWKLMWQDVFDEWWEHTEYWSFTEEGEKSQSQTAGLYDALLSFKYWLLPDSCKRSDPRNIKDLLAVRFSE